jgi:hypothetical protein
MFAQVACQVCGKPFQVPKGQLGETVTCSWCGKPTAAVPLAVKAEPLPAEMPERPRRRTVLPQARPRPSGVRPLVWVVYGVLLLLVAAGVFVGVRMFTGGGGGLRPFVPPDGSCDVLLPGTPREQPVADDEFLKSGKRFVSEPGWGGKLRGEVGWFDIPDAQLARADDLFVLLRDRRAGEFGATAGGEASVRVDARYGKEVRFVKGDEVYVERYLFDPKSSRPRVYWVSVGGAKFDPESATAAKVVGSLRGGGP